MSLIPSEPSSHRSKPATADYFVHERAVCESISIGKGTRIWGNAHILKGAAIGSHCNIGEQVFIESKVIIGDRCTIKNGVALWDLVTLEDGVFIGPMATFTNDLRPRAFLKKSTEEFLPTLIKKGATVGANATIVCGVTLGEYCFIAAGAVVTKNVPAHALIAGVPGKQVGRVCYCGQTLDASDFCSDCELPLNQNTLRYSADLNLKIS